jgi:hypothetical protein
VSCARRSNLTAGETLWITGFPMGAPAWGSSPPSPLILTPGRQYRAESTMIRSWRSRTASPFWCLSWHWVTSAAAISIRRSPSASQQRECFQPSRYALHRRPNRRRHRRRLVLLLAFGGPVANQPWRHTGRHAADHLQRRVISLLVRGGRISLPNLIENALFCSLHHLVNRIGRLDAASAV